MSPSYSKFKAYLADLKNNLKATNGVYIPSKLTPILKNQGVILVSQKDVRRLDFAIKHLQTAQTAIETSDAALIDFDAVLKPELMQAGAVVAEYQEVLTDIVKKAYERRMQAVQGVAA